MSAGNRHTCVVNAEGSLICFGDNESGQCDVPVDLGSIAAVCPGGWHTSVLHPDGTSTLFGNRFWAWKQDGVLAVSNSAVALPMSADNLFTYLLRDDGLLYIEGQSRDTDGYRYHDVRDIPVPWNLLEGYGMGKPC